MSFYIFCLLPLNPAQHTTRKQRHVNVFFPASGSLAIAHKHRTNREEGPTWLPAWWQQQQAHRPSRLRLTGASSFATVSSSRSEISRQRLGKLCLALRVPFAVFGLASARLRLCFFYVLYRLHSGFLCCFQPSTLLPFPCVLAAARTQDQDTPTIVSLLTDLFVSTQRSRRRVWVILGTDIICIQPVVSYVPPAIHTLRVFLF